MSTLWFDLRDAIAQTEKMMAAGLAHDERAVAVGRSSRRTTDGELTRA